MSGWFTNDIYLCLPILQTNAIYIQITVIYDVDSETYFYEYVRHILSVCHLIVSELGLIFIVAGNKPCMTIDRDYLHGPSIIITPSRLKR